MAVDIINTLTIRYWWWLWKRFSAGITKRIVIIRLAVLPLLIVTVVLRLHVLLAIVVVGIVVVVQLAARLHLRLIFLLVIKSILSLQIPPAQLSDGSMI